MVTGDICGALQVPQQDPEAAAGGLDHRTKMFAYSGNPFSVSNSSLAARINSGGGIGNTILSDLLEFPALPDIHSAPAQPSTLRA